MEQIRTPQYKTEQNLIEFSKILQYSRRPQD